MIQQLWERGYSWERVSQAINRPTFAITTYIKLTKHVTGRKSHFVQIAWIPGTHDDASIFRIVLNLVNAFHELIDTLSSVIRVHIDILGTKVAPLKSIDRSQVTHLAMRQATLVKEFTRAITIPNVNVLFRKIVAIGISLETKKVGHWVMTDGWKVQKLFHILRTAMNHKSSSATPRQKVRLVVKSGRVPSRSEKRIWVPNLDKVPVPVRSPRWICIERMEAIVNE